MDDGQLCIAALVDRLSWGEECTQGRSEWVQISKFIEAEAQILDCPVAPVTASVPVRQSWERSEARRGHRAQRRYGEITKELPGVR
jgi:hypothetical protein